MTEITAGEQTALRQQLEDEAALVLGRMQFEFSGLNMNLGLCAAWVDDGRRLDELSPQVAAMTFHKRLEFVALAVSKRYQAGTDARTGYQTWIDRAHAATGTRNQLVHGRWGVEPRTSQVVNVLGLPTSPEQRAVRYTIAELVQVLEELRQLQIGLHSLRERWQL
jgi:membrane-bound lytic murein transglycosylase B